VDEFGQTSIADIYAVGDCAAQLNSFVAVGRVRLESVENANNHAVCVAKHIVGDLAPQVTVPWFWSNQYDLRLQTVGVSAGHDEIVIRGDPAMRSFSIIYLRGGVVLALDCVNATKDYVQGKSLIQDHLAPSKASLADVGTPLKALRPSLEPVTA
jgi:3-phenylpropionate/trans-cinnamate dioxygenase ferredoxin reductase subunit